MMQVLLDDIYGLNMVIERYGIKKIFIVHGKSYNSMPIAKTIEGLNITAIKYSDFTVNPNYDDMQNAVNAFKDNSCDAVLVVGGGSAIDVAKCTKLYGNIEAPLIAIPSTAGSGSEATHFSVLYKNNKKISVAHQDILPNYVVLVPEILDSLPIYQKKCTFLDALCQSIESWWSVKATEESISYSRKSIKLLLDSYNTYLNGTIDENQKGNTNTKKVNTDAKKGNTDANYNMLLGANYSGRAINITQTTAAHALSYGLTSYFGLPHGHAVAICLPVVWQCMLDNLDNPDISKKFTDISNILGYSNPGDAIKGFLQLLKSLEITSPTEVDTEIINSLAKDVNIERLNNSPIPFDANMILNVYEKILKKDLQ